MQISHSVSRNPDSNLSDAPLLPQGVLRVFLLACGLFFLWGIPNNLNDVLIRQFMKAFVLTRFQAGLVQSAFYLGYFTLALPAGLLMKRFGYKTGFLTGLLLFALGCFLFLPAAHAASYPFFLGSLFVVACGLAFLESAANPFVAQLGPTASSERRLNLAQAFNPVGSIFGVLIGTRFIFSGVELTAQQTRAMQLAGTYQAYLQSETLRVVRPYLALGALALLWAVFILITRFPKFIAQRESAAEQRGNWRDLLKERYFLLTLPALFLYVGAQVGTWSYFIQYAQDYAHATERVAGLLLTGTLIAFGLGRFLSSYLLTRIAASRMMLLYSTANILLLAFAIALPGRAGLIAILATSFFMSVMFPTLFAMGLKDLGPNTNVAGSLLVMMIIGGAVLTPLMGLLAEAAHSTALAYLIPLLCYAAIALYSTVAARRTRQQAMLSQFDI